MLEGKLEFIPITEVKVFVSLSYFISKFPLYFATTLLMLLVPIPCIPGVFFDETKILFIYLGFLSHEFEIFMITKFEFLLQIEKSINFSICFFIKFSIFSKILLDNKIATHKIFRLNKEFELTIE